MTATNIATIIAQALEAEYIIKTSDSRGEDAPSQTELIQTIEAALCAGPFSNLPFWLAHYIEIMDHECSSGLTTAEKSTREKLRNFTL